VPRHRKVGDAVNNAPAFLMALLAVCFSVVFVVIHYMSCL
jgi:hypothetical protein